MHNRPSHLSSAATASLFVASLAGAIPGCITSDTELVVLETEGEFNGVPIPETPTPFTLSELANACITPKLECEKGSADCEELNDEIEATQAHFALQLADEYEVDVDPDALLSGEYDDAMNATVFGWDFTARYDDEELNTAYAGMIILPGLVEKPDMENRVDTDTYWFDPLKCGRGWEIVDQVGQLYRLTRSGLTRDGAGTTWDQQTSLQWFAECYPGSDDECIDTEIRRNPHARFEEGTADFAAANSAIAAHIAALEYMVGQVIAADRASSTPADLSVGEHPIAWTTPSTAM